MNADEFRRLGHQLVDWVAEYREGIEDRPVMSPVRPGEIKSRFPASPPADGGHLSEALALLEQDVLRGITHWNHPAFFAYFPSNTAYASVLADILASGLGVQGMSWQTSPAATEIEEVVMDWLRQMVGLSSAWSGVIHDTASTATLCALLCAREKASGFSQQDAGLQAGAPPLVVYASEQGHSSIEKAALLAGFGRSNLRLIATDAEHALDLLQLERAIETDRAAGRRPAAIVAAIGTTGTTAIDPLAGIAALAEQHDAWLHVDAAMAGTAMVLPECRWMWAGVERADSVVVEPAQVDGSRVRFQCLLRSRPRASGAGHEHEPELPAHGPGRRGKEFPRLAHPARATFSGDQAVVLIARYRCRGPSGKAPAGPRERALAQGADRRDRVLGTGRARAAADGVFSPRPARYSRATSPRSRRTTSRLRGGSTRAGRPT